MRRGAAVGESKCLGELNQIVDRYDAKMARTSHA